MKLFMKDQLIKHDNTTDSSETFYSLTTEDITLALAGKKENQFAVALQYRPNNQRY